MHNPPRILIVDDNETNRDILRTRLRPQGYELLEAADGEEALSLARQAASRSHPARRHDAEDRRHRSVPAAEIGRRVCRSWPIILVTAKADSKDVVAGLEAGADEYLTKPVDQAALVARVKSMLRLKELTDQVRAQAADLAGWNRTLEEPRGRSS